MSGYAFPKVSDEITFEDFCCDLIYLIKLNPTMGSEIQKTRPFIIISPNDEYNFIKVDFPFSFIFSKSIIFMEKSFIISFLR